MLKRVGKKKREAVGSTQTLELLEQSSETRRQTSFPTFSNDINSVSISCNRKTFQTRTNILSKRPQTSNL